MPGSDADAVQAAYAAVRKDPRKEAKVKLRLKVGQKFITSVEKHSKKVEAPRFGSDLNLNVNLSHRCGWLSHLISIFYPIHAFLTT